MTLMTLTPIMDDIFYMGDFENQSPVIDCDIREGNILKTRDWVPNNKLVLKKDNRICIENVYWMTLGVWSSPRKTNKLAEFIVIEDVVANNNKLEIRIFPQINSSGIFSNIDAHPKDGAKIIFLGSPRQGYRLAWNLENLDKFN